MKLFLAVINLIIISANADIVVDLGPVELSSTIGKVQPLYKPLQPIDLTATDNALDNVEWFRSRMSTGSGYLPALDPYQIAALKSIEIKSGLVNGYVVMTNLKLDGAKEFVLNVGEIRMSIDTVNVDASIPSIVGNVDFDAEVVVGILPLSILGHLKVVLKDVNIVGVFGSVETQSDIGEVYHAQDDSLTITASNLEVTLSKMSVDADKDVVKEWWGKLKNNIIDILNKAVVQQVNDVMKHYTTTQVRNFLLTPSKM